MLCTAVWSRFVLKAFFEVEGACQEHLTDYLCAAFLQSLYEAGGSLSGSGDIIEDDDLGVFDFGVIHEPPVFVVLDDVVLG